MQKLITDDLQYVSSVWKYKAVEIYFMEVYPTVVHLTGKSAVEE
jgi:hypothetical protein